MDSHNIFHQDRGITLIEMIIVLGMISLIVALGLFLSMDFYKSFSFRSEANTIVSVLQKARSQAINNINQTRHGVYFATSPCRYILFECSNCTDYVTGGNEIIIPASFKISFVPTVFVFEQLNGNCVNCSSPESNFTVTDGAKTYEIEINPAGRINW